MKRSLPYTTMPGRRAWLFAAARVDNRQPGQRWVHCHEFTQRAEAEDVRTTSGLEALYASMLKEGDHVFG